VLAYLLYASLLGGMLTLLVLKFRSEALPAALVRQDWVMRLHNEKSGVPYGIALAVAALLVYPDTIIMQQLAS
jgi:prepilin peptidase CpaA